MAEALQVLRALSDGRFRSGEELAGTLGCSRSAIWKHVKQLRQQAGLQIDAVTGRGYRLAEPLELLERESILQHLSRQRRTELGALHVEDVVGSTNELALQQARRAATSSQAWLAETQTGGRGRRGRTWHSPYGRNLYFSLLHQFEMPLHRLAGLSIAVGLELAGMLTDLGLQDHGLKWPNDLYWRGGKLAGILIEAHGESEGPASAVIGVGLNIDLGTPPEWLDQPVCSLRDAGLEVSRNRIAGELIGRMLNLCERFAAEGLTPFAKDWPRYGLYQGERVSLSGPGSRHVGILRGLSPDGGVRIQVDHGERVFYGGELSLRRGTGDV